MLTMDCLPQHLVGKYRPLAVAPAKRFAFSTLSPMARGLLLIEQDLLGETLCWVVIRPGQVN
jgi:hypothetical protein